MGSKPSVELKMPIPNPDKLLVNKRIHEPYMESLGYRYLSRGAFGRVYVHDTNPNWVMKVFHDRGYHKFLGLIAKSKSKHFPQVQDQRKINFEYSMVFIEKLKPLGDQSIYCDYAQDIAYGLYDKQPRELEKVEERYKRKLKYYPTFKRAIQYLKKDHRGGWDLHPANIMMRGDIPVITDPWV